MAGLSVFPTAAIWRQYPTSHQCGNQVANRVAYAQLMVQGLVQSNEQTIEYGAVMLNRAAKLERGSKQASFPCIKQGTQF